MSQIKIKIAALVVSLALVTSAGVIQSQKNKNLDGVGSIHALAEEFAITKETAIAEELEEERKELERIEQAKKRVEETLNNVSSAGESVEDAPVVNTSYVYPTYIQEVATVVDAVSTEATLSDIELIALITMAEAEGEPVEGKRLVIDTILNRVDNAAFPNTVYDVIYQSGQFTCVWNGRLSRCYVSEDICQLVREELESRYSYDTIYFCAGGYSGYGTPLFQVGNHYFSSF